MKKTVSLILVVIMLFSVASVCVSAASVATPKATASNAVGGIKVYWSAVNGAVKYNVYRRVGGSSSWIYAGSTSGTNIIDKGVTNGKYYAYSVRAYNSQGNYSAYNRNMTYNVKCVATPRLTSLVNNTNGLKLTWSAVSGAKYRIYRRGAGSSVWTYLGTTNSTTYIDSKASSGQYWRYTVRAISDGYYSGFDTNGLYTMRLANPYSIKATQVQGGVNVTWAKISGATGYRVYRRGAGQTSWAYLGSTTGHSFKDTKIAYGENYYRYTVRATRGNIYSCFYASGSTLKTYKARVTYSAEIGEINGKTYAIRCVGKHAGSPCYCGAGGVYDGLGVAASQTFIPALPQKLKNDNRAFGSFCYYDGYVYYIVTDVGTGAVDRSLYRCKPDWTNIELLADFEHEFDGTDDYTKTVDRIFIIEENILYINAQGYSIDLSTMRYGMRDYPDHTSNFVSDYNDDLYICNDTVFVEDSNKGQIYLYKNGVKKVLVNNLDETAMIEGGYANGYLYYCKVGKNYLAELYKVNISTGKTEFVHKANFGGSGLYFCF